jgi:ribosome-associated protein
MIAPARKGALKVKHSAEQILSWAELPDEVKLSVEALREKKVEYITVHDLRSFTPFCDIVILGTVHSSAQAKVAMDSVSKAMKEAGFKLWGVEGSEDSSWLLIDFWDVVVHLFRPESRGYYNLEALWADLPVWSDEESD